MGEKRITLNIRKPKFCGYPQGNRLEDINKKLILVGEKFVFTNTGFVVDNVKYLTFECPPSKTWLPLVIVKFKTITTTDDLCVIQIL